MWPTRATKLGTKPMMILRQMKRFWAIGADGALIMLIVSFAALLSAELTCLAEIGQAGCRSGQQLECSDRSEDNGSVK